jgi:hypothetical protein
MGIGWGRPGVFALLITTLVSVWWVLPVGAQEGGWPPWPIVYEGTVELDGERLESGMLRVQLGDWVSSEVPVLDGRFACADSCLILGPPTFDYIGAEVSFHLSGLERPASLEFEFPALDEPERRTVALQFESGTWVPVWLLGSAGGLAVLVAGAVLALMFRRETPS